MHPAEIPVRAILAALPEHAVLSGFWVQTRADGTLEADCRPVYVSVQWKRGGYASSEGAGGESVNAASQALLAKLRKR